MPTKKNNPPDEVGNPVKRTIKKTTPKKSTAPAKKAPPKKEPVKKTVKKAETHPAAKNDNLQADQKKPRPRSPVNGVELPVGKPIQAGERARELGRKGGIRSAQVKKERKTLREELLALLQVTSKDSEGKEHTQQEHISAALIREARSGNVRAFETIRDTIGEKAPERIEAQVATPKFESLDDAFSKMSGDAQ